MSAESIYHYVYRITNLTEQKHYYGARSCSVHPSEDLGIKYFSSSSDSEFISEQKLNPDNFKYKIVSLHATRKEANFKESVLHKKFNVASNEEFYNKVNQPFPGENIDFCAYTANPLIIEEFAIQIK